MCVCVCVKGEKGREREKERKREREKERKRKEQEREEREERERVTGHHHNYVHVHVGPRQFATHPHLAREPDSEIQSSHDNHSTTCSDTTTKRFQDPHLPRIALRAQG